jgi:hypothetical protein
MSKVSVPPALLPLTPPVFHILLALADEERHGYELDDERRRYYRMTELGKTTVRAEASRLASAVSAAKAKLGLAGGKS